MCQGQREVPARSAAVRADSAGGDQVTDTLTIPSRPYAEVKGSEPSVTTILGVKNVPGLDWAAAKLTAEYAVYEEEWMDANREAPVEVDNLRRYFRGIWDGRAYMGTIVHAMLESWVKHETVDIHTLVDAHSPWQKVHDQKVDEAMGYVNGLAAWWDDAEPSDIRTEECIRTPGQYVGTRDLMCTINGQRWLLDLKTTAHKDPKKGVYGDSWALQLAAYRFATEVVTYEWVESRDSRGKPKNVLAVKDAVENEPVDRCGIVHLRGDGKYTMFEVDADLDVYGTFTHLIPIAAFLKAAPAPVPVDLGGNRD